MDILLVILIVGILGLLALCWVWPSVQEGFATATDAAAAWSTTPADKKARADHTCTVLRSMEDTEANAEGLSGVRIEIVAPTCEAGLPHTSDANTIRLTEESWSRRSAAERAATLRHERAHIRQRRDPEAWRTFYAKAWSYTLSETPPPHLPAEILEGVRGNPDTAHSQTPWACWQGRYWFVPLYADPHQPRLPDARTPVWDARDQILLDEPPEAWRAFFCGGGTCPYQREHPHEIAAEIWTALGSQGSRNESPRASTPAALALLGADSPLSPQVR